MSRFLPEAVPDNVIFSHRGKFNDFERKIIMQRLLKWLGTRLFAQPAVAPPSDTRPRLRVVPPKTKPANATRKPVDKKAPENVELIGFETDIGGRIEDAGPGKNVLIRSKYVREDTGTHETLRIIDDSLIDSDEETGFDPYNTGQFDRSKSWKYRTRK